MNSYQKTAVFLSSLPDEQCVEIIKHLKEEDVQRVTREMLTLGQLDAKARYLALQEVHQAISGRAATLNEGGEYVESILARAYGMRRAHSLMTHFRETESSQIDLDDLAGEIGPEAVAADLQLEHPQVISTILASLSTKKAADIVSYLPEDFQLQAVTSLALGRAMPPDLVEKIKRGFTEKLLQKKSAKRSIGKEGVRSSAEILALMSGEKSKKLLDSLKEKDAELAKSVEAAMFSFDDIVKVEDKDLQKIITSINQQDLKLALRKSNDASKEKIFKNMSERSATMLKEDIEMMGPQKKELISSAQQRIVAVIRKLEESGEITIARGQGEEASLV